MGNNIDTLKASVKLPNILVGSPPPNIIFDMNTQNTITIFQENTVFISNTDTYDIRDTLQDFTDMELSSSVDYVPTILQLNSEEHTIGFGLTLNGYWDHQNFVWINRNNEFCVAGNPLAQILVNACSEEFGEWIIGAGGDNFRDKKGNTVQVTDKYASLRIPINQNDGAESTLRAVVDIFVVEMEETLNGYVGEFPDVVNIYGASVVNQD